MRNGLPVIGLTGGIGSGKSLVAGVLQSLGCVVADADAHVKDILKEKIVCQKLFEWWGDRVLTDDGQVDRSEVAKIVFEDDSQRLRLESLVHPMVEEMQKKQFDAAPKGTIALVIDAPLLIETGLDECCDVVIFVDAPHEIRQKRVLETRGWDVDELNRREATQLPLDTKRKRADYVVINAGELELVQSQVKDVLADMQARQFKEN